MATLRIPSSEVERLASERYHEANDCIKHMDRTRLSSFFSMFSQKYSRMYEVRATAVTLMWSARTKPNYDIMLTEDDFMFLTQGDINKVRVTPEIKRLPTVVTLEKDEWDAMEVDVRAVCTMLECFPATAAQHLSREHIHDICTRIRKVLDKHNA